MANTNLIAYLSFPGNCGEAMEFYKSVFGGELQLLKYEGTPMANDENKDKIMHSHLLFDGATLMAADIMDGTEIKSGNNITLLIDPPSHELGGEYLSKLAEGGNVIMPYEKTFWGAYFGMVSDKYGFIWSVNFEENE